MGCSRSKHSQYQFFTGGIFFYQDDQAPPVDHFIMNQEIILTEHIVKTIEGVEKFEKVYSKSHNIKDLYPVNGKQFRATHQIKISKMYRQTTEAIVDHIMELKQKIKFGQEFTQDRKYTLKQAISQLSACLYNFQKSGISLNTPINPKIDMKQLKHQILDSPENYEIDETDYSGWQSVPGIFLRQATIYPYWGELLKNHIVEFEVSKGKSKESTWNNAAGIIVSLLHDLPLYKQNRTDPYWISGFLEQSSLQHLERAVDTNHTFVFPGWIAGWSSLQDAKKYLCCKKYDPDFNDRLSQQTKDSLIKVIIKVSNSAWFDHLGRAFDCRLKGKIILCQDTPETGGDRLCKYEVVAHSDKRKRSIPQADAWLEHQKLKDLGVTERPAPLQIDYMYDAEAAVEEGLAELDTPNEAY